MVPALPSTEVTTMNGSNVLPSCCRHLAFLVCCVRGAVLQPIASHAFLAGRGAGFNWSLQPGYEPVRFSVLPHWDPLKTGLQFLRLAQAAVTEMVKTCMAVRGKD